MASRRVRRLTAAALALTLLFAACGDDDDETTAGDTTDALSEAADSVSDAATDEEEGTDGEEDGAPDVNPCAEGQTGAIGDAPAEPAPGATPVTITGTEYAFAGAEGLGAQGSYAVTFTNAGQELHEMSLVRLPEGETRPIEELLELPEDELEPTEVSFAFACPGSAAGPVAANIDAPGRYVMFCFIPVGTLPTTPPAQFGSLGPPHFTQGMVAEFTVA